MDNLPGDAQIYQVASEKGFCFIGRSKQGKKNQMWINRTSGGMIEPLLRKYFPLRSANISGEDVQH